MRSVVIFLLMGLFSEGYGFGQESYNVCQNALELCPDIPVSVNNINANITSCVNCEDDFNYCFTPDNSIWFQFTTNGTGGAIQVDFSNLLFETSPGQDNELQAALVEATVPCAANTYTQIGSCHFDETTNFSLTAPALLPNTTYFLVVDGDNNGAGITEPAECTFDLVISGAAVNRPLPSSSVSSSAPIACENDIVTYTVNLTDCPDTSNFFLVRKRKFSCYHRRSVLSINQSSRCCYRICEQYLLFQIVPSLFNLQRQQLASYLFRLMREITRPFQLELRYN